MCPATEPGVFICKPSDREGPPSAARFGILLSVRSFPRTVRIWAVLSVLSALHLAASQSLRAMPQAATAASAPAAPGGQAAQPPSVGLNIVVLDPAHGGTDLGARGTEGVRESEVVLQFAERAKRALEAQGFQVLLTRQSNDNPSFDDRSARANAQRGAIFVSLHIASTGLVGTVRTYVMSD